MEIKKIYHIVKVLEQNPFLDTMKAVLGSDGEELNSFMTLILDFEETYVYSAIQEQIGGRNEELVYEFA